MEELPEIQLTKAKAGREKAVAAFFESLAAFFESLAALINAIKPAIVKAIERE